MIQTQETVRKNVVGPIATTTEIPLGFTYNQAADIKVLKTNDDETTETLEYNIGFTVTVDGLSIKLTEALTSSDEKITIYRITPRTQEDDYQQSGRFPAEVTENGLDNLVRMITEQAEQLSRSIQLPLNSDIIYTGASLPNPRANSIIGYDSLSNLTTFLITDLSDAVSIAARLATVEATVDNMNFIKFTNVEGVDQSRAIQVILDAYTTRGGVLVIDCATALTIDAAVNVPSNVHVEVRCPISFGEYGQLRIYGGFEETPETDLPKIRQDLVAGTYTIYCGVQAESLASNYSVGDKIIIRGMSDGNGQAIEKQECTVATVDTGNNNITVVEPLEYDFQVSYPAGDYEASFGTTDWTFITFQTFALFDSDANRGDYSIEITDPSDFAVGDYIFLGDEKVPADLASGASHNTYRHEVNKIIDITGTTVSLEHATSHAYETAYGAYIIKMVMVENASISGAKVNYYEEPSAFTINPFSIVYAKDCYINNCIVANAGSYTSKGHGFRIDRAIDCHTYNCAVYPPAYVDAAEGYGFTFYRSNHCSHNNAYARGCRHSFLAFRGASFNQFNNVISIDARVSDIDFHGGEEYGNTVDGFTIQGGDQKYGVNLAAIKFGNESHVAGAYNNVVRNGVVYDYKGFGINFVPISSGNVVENVVFRNNERLVRCVDLALDSTLIAADNTIRNCFIDSQTQRIGTIDGTLNGGSSQIIDGLVIEGCIFRNIQEHFRTIENTINCKIINNIILDAIDATGEADPYIVRAVNSDNLLVQGNHIEGGTRFVKITDCPNFVCRENILKNFYETEVLDDVSGNDNYIFEYNEYIGFDETYAASGGGSTGGSIRNKHQANMAALTFSAGFPMDVEVAIPFDDTVPQVTEGVEILSCQYTPKNSSSRLKVDVIVPAVYTDVATNAVLAIFQDGACVGASGIRIPNNGTSSGHFIQATAIVEVTSKTPIPFTARIGPKTTGGGETLTVGSNFGGLSDPTIIIQEISGDGLISTTS